MSNAMLKTWRLRACRSDTLTGDTLPGIARLRSKPENPLGVATEEEAPDLSSYLAMITTPDKDLLRRIRANTRYSDGETATQWLVQEYLTGT